MSPYSPRSARRVAEITRALWFVPALMAVVGIALGLVMPGIDAIPRVLAAGRNGGLRSVMDSAPAGAQQVLATSAGALATILGVAFSLTLVTLQLAASQYTPRLVGRLLEDRVTKLVLGAYIGTVAYLLLVLRAVHGVGDQQPPFVPRLSMTLGLALILGCLALLAYFVHHLGASIQAASLAAGVAERTRSALEAVHREPGEPMAASDAPGGPHGAALSDAHGYVQLIDRRRLAAALPPDIVTAQVLVAAGDFILPGQPLVALWPRRTLEPAEEKAVVGAFALGPQRTEDQDVLYGIRLLADVGLKALSPAVNDETTAVTAVNQIGVVLAEATRFGEGTHWRCHRSGGKTVFWPGLTFRRMVEDGYGGLIRFSGDHPRVLARIVEVIGVLLVRVAPCDGREALLEAAGWVEAALDATDIAPHERRLIAARIDALRAGRVGGPEGPHAMH